MFKGDKNVVKGTLPIIVKYLIKSLCQVKFTFIMNELHHQVDQIK